MKKQLNTFFKIGHLTSLISGDINRQLLVYSNNFVIEEAISLVRSEILNSISIRIIQRHISDYDY